MTTKELEIKLNEIYQDFGSSITENESDECALKRCKSFFIEKLKELKLPEKQVEELAIKLESFVKQLVDSNED